jgi:hypothetical protein
METNLLSFEIIDLSEITEIFGEFSATGGTTYNGCAGDNGACSAGCGCGGSNGNCGATKKDT